MSGRSDYEERKQMKKERYEELADKAEQKSNEYYQNHNKISNMIPLGQPILVDHYSASRHRNALKKMDNAMRKSIEENEKADYYKNKVDSIENNNSISSDDPKAIEKIDKKIQELENRKVEIKAREHATYELTNINQEIRRLKARKKELQELEELDFKDTEFKGGKVILNRDVNRIQFIFDSIPSSEIRDILKGHAFKWSKTEGAWQRLYNKNCVYATKRALEAIQALNNKERS